MGFVKAFLKVVPIAVIVFALCLGGLTFMIEKSQGPAAIHTVEGQVIGLSLTPKSDEFLTVTLDDRVVDGCDVDTQKCRPDGFNLFSVPNDELSQAIALGDFATFECVVGPVTYNPIKVIDRVKCQTVSIDDY